MSTSDYISGSDDELRILLLIHCFTTPKQCLRGRTKLAKLDFFLRYPKYLRRAVFIRNSEEVEIEKFEKDNIDNRMVRYKYGPWDPSYYYTLGNLIGKRLVKTVKTKKGIGYKTTEKGDKIAENAKGERAWSVTWDRIRVVKRNLNLTGNSLKEFIYENFPKVTNANWGEEI